jgi:cytidine deaminase
VPTTLTDPEDAKLLTLARATRARAGSPEGAAVRDTDGRTYAAAALNLPSLQLSATQVAVAMAASSGIRGLEAVVVMTESVGISETDVAVVRDFGGGDVPIHRADGAGTVVESVTT